MVDAHTAELVASGLLVASALGGMEVGEWAPAMGSWASRKTVEWKKTKEVADWVVALKALPESVGLDGSGQRSLARLRSKIGSGCRWQLESGCYGRRGGGSHGGRRGKNRGGGGGYGGGTH
ncbi:hypothetical protein CYMTET_19140 [Cymbomonas tetramitiformis]|uniref:Uncharacterized protein n=1 Tax=Cymbomonas tetramitiformis TaxID=36881 RepID=A0AAE0G735_9CHLO|nr:hypothetical protein CYMTET_19140 [Cymbomonas tetramitiformis]